MGAENVSLSLRHLPIILIAIGALKTMLVSFLHALSIFFRNIIAGLGVREEEGVVSFASGMGLGLDEGIEVPERGLDIPLRGHFIETHL